MSRPFSLATRRLPFVPFVPFVPFAPFALLAFLVAGAAWAAQPLVYCADASPEGFDPGRWDSSSTANATRPIFQGLLRFKPGSTELQPELASAWTMSADAKVFDFELRRGVRFHRTADFTPTRAFNADDLLFTFGRFVDPQHPFNKALPTPYVYPESLGLARQIEAIERLGEHAVRFRLRKANVSFASYMALAFAGIQSAEYAAQLLREGRPQALNNRPVGTGPYRFRSYVKDDVLRLEANPDSWGAPQRTRQLIFAIAREPNVRVQKLLAGECHLTSPLRDVDVATVARRPDVARLHLIQALNISYLAFNLKKPPFDDRRVREALDIAVDRDAVFKALFPRGDAQQAVNAMPPSVPGFNDSLRNEFNPARARALLAEAGHPQGFELDLWALPVARPTNPNGQLMAQLIQQDWARIGVRARIKTYEWGEYLKRANKGEHDVYMSGWSGETGDADDMLAPNLSCAASKGGIKFCNRAFDELLERARASGDAAERVRLYREANALFKRERPWITMAHSTIYIGTRKDVKGFVMAPNGAVNFEGVYRE
ncbi:ABC transporter substrate-binding protein [Pseudorhodoferax sp.]|uniref:ABC transporter substrate-binding protein n=1 Tax=Pseudorhodoferax sp. TaxID=1993553 RepID=UPI002DD64FB0|nr:ABC transporter substrate-binding protein [Pseudorhodoferax sp.]